MSGLGLRAHAPVARVLNLSVYANNRGRVMEQAWQLVEQALGLNLEGKYLTVTHMALA